ncbi:MAG: hypothetical protein JWM12_3176 [Ilumatobacteraceae bacterium]|nr:hypothetical protein [Ilumatobacteraceae bacterium]
MPFAAHPLPPIDPTLTAIAERLNPLLQSRGFHAGQAGSSEGCAQIIYCRGFDGSLDDGCIDLVVDLELAGECRVTDVRYWGFPSDRWHLGFARDASLADQLAGLERTLPDELQ